ncbi:MAG: hypothetical protein MK033_04605 [Candidatus Caenarcaniphilales bacterium]|nr:hypothetical protein [Candidatus Caenarcaniphilales bacterium]
MEINSNTIESNFQKNSETTDFLTLDEIERGEDVEILDIEQEEKSEEAKLAEMERLAYNKSLKSQMASHVSLASIYESMINSIVSLNYFSEGGNEDTWGAMIEGLGEYAEFHRAQLLELNSLMKH